MSDTPRTDLEALVDSVVAEQTAIEEITRLRAFLAAANADLNLTQARVERLRAELAQRTAERDAANARLALSMEAHQITISGTVASLLHTITLTREAAGCRDGDNLRAFVSDMRTMIDAIESIGYEWRWTKSIDENGEQVGAWVMRREEGGA
jgi:hypothetical protein